MSEMVERVARAICAKEVEIGAYDWEPDEIPDGEEAPAWQFWVSEARAAIEAMREPTDAQLTAAHAHGENHAREVAQAWRDMIDEALK